MSLKLMQIISCSFLVFWAVVSLPTSRIAILGPYLINSDLFELLNREMIHQKDFTSKIHCAELCLRHQKCLTFESKFHHCALFSFNVSGILDSESQASPNFMFNSIYGFSTKVDNFQCFFDGEKTTTEESIHNCEIGYRVNSKTSSNCTEWGPWMPTIHEEVCPGSRLFSKRNRTRSCPESANQFAGCNEVVFEEQTKFPTTHKRDDGFGRHAALTFCENKTSTLFTNVFLLKQNNNLTQVPEEDFHVLMNSEYYIQAKYKSGKFEVKDQGMGAEFFPVCAELNSEENGNKDCVIVRYGKIMNKGCAGKLQQIVCEQWKLTDSKTCADEL